MNQRRSCGHAHITSLDILDDFVLLALIRELKVLAVNIKCRSRIVGYVEPHLVTERGSDIGLNLLVKIKIGFTAL